jgi:trimeric autotransporter adhesin
LLPLCFLSHPHPQHTRARTSSPPASTRPPRIDGPEGNALGDQSRPHTALRPRAHNLSNFGVPRIFATPRGYSTRATTRPSNLTSPAPRAMADRSDRQPGADGLGAGSAAEAAALLGALLERGGSSSLDVGSALDAALSGDAAGAQEVLALLMALQGRAGGGGAPARGPGAARNGAAPSASVARAAADEIDDDADDEEVLRLHAELARKQDELRQLQETAAALDTLLGQQAEEVDEMEADGEEDGEEEDDRGWAGGEDGVLPPSSTRPAPGPRPASSVAPFRADDGALPEDADADDAAGLAHLAAQLQEAMATAAALESEAQRLTSVRDGLQAALDDARQQEAGGPSAPRGTAQGFGAPNPRQTSLTSSSTAAAAKSASSSSSPLRAPSAADSNGLEEGDEEALEAAALLPILQAEARMLAGQAAALQRGEALPEGSPDPARVVSALEERLALLSRLERLMQMEAAIKAVVAAEEAQAAAGGGSDGDGQGAADDDDDVAAVAALPNPTSARAARLPQAGAATSSAVEVESDDDEDEDGGAGAREASLALEADLRELRMLEARADQLRAQRAALAEQLEAAQQEKQSASRARSVALGRSPSAGAPSSSSSAAAAAPARPDFSSLPVENQVLVVRARLALMSACMEAAGFNDMVAYAVATVGTKEADADEAAAAVADSVAAGPPAFISAAGLTAVLRVCVRRAALAAARDMGPDASLESLTASDAFVDAFRRESVSVLLDPVPVAANMLAGTAAESDGEEQGAGTGTGTAATDMSLASTTGTAAAAAGAAPAAPAPAPAPSPSPSPLAAPSSSSAAAPVPVSAAPPSAAGKSLSSTTAKTAAATSRPSGGSRIDRLAQPRHRVVLPAKAQHQKDAAASGGSGGSGAAGADIGPDGKPVFRVWPRTTSLSTKLPKRGRSLPKAPDVLGEAHRAQQEAAASAFGGAFDGDGQEEEIEMGYLTGGGGGGGGGASGMGRTFSFRAGQGGAASSSSAAASSAFAFSRFGVEEAMASPRNTARAPGASGVAAGAALAGTTTTALRSSRFAEAAATASVGATRARQEWEIPSHTANASLPPLRVFDATASSARRREENVTYLREVLPMISAGATLPRGIAPLEPEPVTVGGEPGGAGGGYNTDDGEGPARSLSPSRSVRSRTVSPVRPFDAESVLGGRSVASRRTSSTRPGGGGGGGASSAATYNNRSKEPIAPGQTGRRTMIHALQSHHPTRVHGRSWSKIAGNAPANARRTFRILHLAKVPPPPPSYWFTAHSVATHPGHANPIGSVMADLRGELRQHLSALLSPKGPMEQLRASFAATRPPTATPPTVSPTLRKFEAVLMEQSRGPYSPRPAAVASPTAAAAGSYFPSTSQFSPRVPPPAPAAAVSVAASVAATTSASFRFPTSFPLSPAAVPAPVSAWSAPVPRAFVAPPAVPAASTTRETPGGAGIGLRAAASIRSEGTGIWVPAPVSAPAPAPLRPSLHIEPHDEEEVSAPVSSPGLKRAPTLHDLEESSFDQVATAIIRARERITAASSVANSRTAVTDAAFGPRGLVPGPVAALPVLYNDSSDEEAEKSARRTASRPSTLRLHHVASHADATVASHAAPLPTFDAVDDGPGPNDVARVMAAARDRIASASFRVNRVPSALATARVGAVEGDEDGADYGAAVDGDDSEDEEEVEVEANDERVAAAHAQAAAAQLEPAGLADSRPTTSRGVPHPTADQFFSYVRSPAEKTKAAAAAAAATAAAAEAPSAPALFASPSGEAAARLAAARLGVTVPLAAAAPAQLDLALAALREQAARFEARVLRRTADLPETASASVESAGEDDEGDQEGEDEDEQAAAVVQSYVHAPTNQPYDYAEDVRSRTASGGAAAPWGQRDRVPAIWSSGPQSGAAGDDYDEGDVDTDGASSVTTDLGHLDATALEAAARAEEAEEEAAQRRWDAGDVDSHDGGSTAEADAALAAGILRAADDAAARFSSSRARAYQAEAEYAYGDEEEEDEDGRDERGSPSYPDALAPALADASLNSSYIAALADAERAASEQRRMVAELYDVAPALVAAAEAAADAAAEAAASVAASSIDDGANAGDGGRSVLTEEYEVAAAALANKRSPVAARRGAPARASSAAPAAAASPSRPAAAAAVESVGDGDENDDDGDEDEEEEDSFVGNHFGEAGSISSWTHADSEMHTMGQAGDAGGLLHGAGAGGAGGAGGAAASAQARRAAQYRRRYRRWGADMKQRKASALTVALRAIDSWGSSVPGSPGAVHPRALRVGELEDLLLALGASLTGLAPGILALAAEREAEASQDAEVDEDGGVVGLPPDPLSTLRRRRVVVAGAKLHGLQAFAYSVWATARSSLHAALLSYVGSDARSPATQKWLLRDVRTGLADWASIASAALAAPTPAPAQRSAPPAPAPSATSAGAVAKRGAGAAAAAAVAAAAATAAPAAPPARRFVRLADGTWAAQAVREDEEDEDAEVDDDDEEDEDGAARAAAAAGEYDDGCADEEGNDDGSGDFVFHTSASAAPRGGFGSGGGLSAVRAAAAASISVRIPEPPAALAGTQIDQTAMLNAALLAAAAKRMPSPSGGIWWGPGAAGGRR